MKARSYRNTRPKDEKPPWAKARSSRPPRPGSRSRDEKSGNMSRDKPYQRSRDDDKPYQRRSRDDDKPYQRRSRDQASRDRPFRERRSRDDDKPYQRRSRDDDKPYQRSRDQASRDRPFRERRSRDDDKPYQRRSRDQASRDRPFRERRSRDDDKPYQRRSRDDDKPYQRSRDDNKPYQRSRDQQDSKFYQAMQEKIYAILGDKVCSNCGFGDERALRIRNMRDQPYIGRGGSVSWDKYVSDPGLAREDLRVLCLNCDATARPASRPKQPKKKRFPR